MQDVPDWSAHVARTVRRLRDRLGRRWVVAVSGGSDSVGLIRILHGIAPRLGLTLSVAHLDHGARGEAGREDAWFVASLAETLGLPIDLGGWAPSRPAHFEADARLARYGWLAEVAARRGAEVVAVGHTRDDQAETLLHRIVRGTGPRGLAGMPRTRRLIEGVTLARPLLAVGHDDLRAYLAGLGQPWREDLTNLDTARTRSRIRHKLLPELARGYNPSVVEALIRLARLTRAAVVGLDEHVLAIAQTVVLANGPGRIVLDRLVLAGLSPFLRAEVLRSVWRSAGWPEAAMDADRWRRLAARVLRTEGGSDVGAGVRVVVGADRVELARSVATLDKPLAIRSVPLDLPGEADWPGGRIEATIVAADDRVQEPFTEWVDLDRLAPPLRVETARLGDRFDPLGMGGGTTPLADFFRGRRVARSDRALVPLVKDASGIVWVVGHRISHRVRLTDATRNVARLRWLAARDR